MKLTEMQVRKAKPAARDYKLSDGKGLYLLVSAAASKLWRYRYRWDGREQTLSLGEYPAVGLAEARQGRQEARDDLRAGRHPGRAREARQSAAASSSARDFETVAREWYGIISPTWGAEHAEAVIRGLEANVFPYIGRARVDQIEPRDILDLSRRVEARGAIETAHLIRQRISAVFVFAIASGDAKIDPAAPVLPALMPIIRGRHPAVKTLDEARKVLADCDQQAAGPVVRLAHRFLALTAARAGMVRFLPWSEIASAIDANMPVWRVPAARMKLSKRNKEDPDRDHLVPLPWQAIEILRTIRPLTGRCRYVFSSSESPLKPISENTIGLLLKRAGYQGRHVAHGWRATFSTVMNERHRADRYVIDLMLAHLPAGVSSAEIAYNRALHLDRRRELAREWADLLTEGLAPPAEIVNARRR